MVVNGFGLVLEIWQIGSSCSTSALFVLLAFACLCYSQRELLSLTLSLSVYSQPTSLYGPLFCLPGSGRVVFVFISSPGLFQLHLEFHIPVAFFVLPSHSPSSLGFRATIFSLFLFVPRSSSARLPCSANLMPPPEMATSPLSPSQSIMTEAAAAALFNIST